jgi:serine/threonine-protein kinase RsbW
MNGQPDVGFIMQIDQLDSGTRCGATAHCTVVPSATVMLEIPADLAYVHMLGRCICALLENNCELEEPDITLYNLELAVQEVGVNIINHAYAHTGGRIQLYATVDSQSLQLTILLHDIGNSFDPEAVPYPRLGELQEHGFGLFLVRQLMDEVTYKASPTGNTWKLIKYLPVKTIDLKGK